MRGLKRFAVNGQEVKPTIQKGYAVVTREWKRGDRIDLELPLEPQRIQADKRIQADRDLVALKYGPGPEGTAEANSHASGEALTPLTVEPAPAAGQEHAGSSKRSQIPVESGWRETSAHVAFWTDHTTLGHSDLFAGRRDDAIMVLRGQQTTVVVLPVATRAEEAVTAASEYKVSE